MRITNDMLEQIREWISQDKIVVAKTKRLKELAAKHRTTIGEHRRAELDLFHKTARAIKKVDWKLSLADRRKEQEALTMKHTWQTHELFAAMRRKTKKMETQMQQAAMVIGKRRGYLRYHFEQKFVLIAQRERIRMERKKPFTEQQQ